MVEEVRLKEVVVITTHPTNQAAQGGGIDHRTVAGMTRLALMVGGVGGGTMTTERR